MNASGARAASIGTVPLLAALALAATLLYLAFHEALAHIVESWSRPEYSHGYLIPVISGYLIWQRRAALQRTPFTGSWLGALGVGAGLGLLVLGELSTIYTIMEYAFLATLIAAALSLLGWRAFGLIWVPLVYLLFMVALPDFLYFNLSGKLQLISSQLGVAVIRLFGISVYLEGNVIDLGTYKLQVAEACDGLRYLFPLMSFGFLCAYLFKGAWWQRALLFLSTIPITILMNSFRIGVIGVLVEHWGEGMADGFLHYFEGWVVFMACVALLFGEMWLLLRFDPRGRSFWDVFDLSASEPLSPGGRKVSRIAPFLVSIVLLGVGALGLRGLTERTVVEPEREVLATFPLRFAEWTGVEQSIEQIYLDTLQLDDYLVANYRRNRDFSFVNLYVAYYQSQQKGASIHSPRSCIPAGGWQIAQFAPYRIESAVPGGRPLTVNRTVVAKGELRQLVYYWFPQRGRNLTNEYIVKWFLFWDALTRNRTDGALVRLSIDVPRGGNVAVADAALSDFLRAVYPHLIDYIPE